MEKTFMKLIHLSRLSIIRKIGTKKASLKMLLQHEREALF
ncbi:hypothetical protein C2W64_01917 [Brevibacillus laterosporus]|nr:hypothetical protein C2W64_01917 [Brevibacillus laterosporus]